MAQLHRSVRAAGSGALPLAAGERAWLPRLGAFRLRPLASEDHAAYRAFGARLDGEDLRLRFAGPIKRDSPLCEELFFALDHERVEVFAAVDDDGEILGLARVVRSEPGAAEGALIMRSDLKRRGLGRLLLDRALRHACRLGMHEFRAQILYENRPMLELAVKSGFRFVRGSGVLAELSRALSCPPCASRCA